MATTKTSPTKRTLDALRKDGWTCQVVERWNPFAKQRLDLFGCIDVVALHPGITLGVQCTTADHLAERVAKVCAEPRIRAWIEAGNQMECWGWAKKGPRGKRKTWEVNIREITIEQLEAVA